MIYSVEYYDHDEKTRFTTVNVSMEGLIPFAVKSQNKRYAKIKSITQAPKTAQVPQYQASKKEIKQAESLNTLFTQERE